MSRQWISLSCAGLLGLVGCAENRLNEANQPLLEDQQTLEDRQPTPDQFAADDPTVVGPDTIVVPQHVLKPEIDGDTIQPLDLSDGADPFAPAPESTPEKLDTGKSAIEDSLIDVEEIDSEDLQDRVGKALDLEPGADAPDKTTATLRADDEPIRDRPTTDTPVLDQEQLEDGVAPLDSTAAIESQLKEPQDQNTESASTEEQAEETEALADALSDAVGDADSQAGDAADGLEERLKETLKPVTPDDSAENLPPTIPLEDPAAATEPKDDNIAVEANKPVFDLPTDEPERFQAAAFAELNSQQSNEEAATKEISKVELELAAMREALGKQRMAVGEVDVHLNSLQKNLSMLRVATSENLPERQQAVKTSAMALEVSLREARRGFRDLTITAPADDEQTESGEAANPFEQLDSPDVQDNERETSRETP